MCIRDSGWTFAPGDKVMQIENDYDKEVYNGDIGFVADVEPEEGELTASFDGRSVTYSFGELDALVPAYAASIHKSQGSEYPAVVIPVMTQHYAMLQLSLIHISTFWPSGQTFFHHAWCASSLILPVTGGSSMSELKP